jgi:hypothetical protein
VQVLKSEAMKNSINGGPELDKYIKNVKDTVLNKLQQHPKPILIKHSSYLFFH